MEFADHPLQRFSRADMAYESINVKMTRTGTSITWGFSLRQNGAAIAVAFVEKDSMADKAGLQANDTVEQLFGSKPGSLNDAQRRIQNSNEVNMTLKRFVAVPPGLPWTLEEAGNQVVVNRLDSQGRLAGTYDKNTQGYQNSFQSTQSYGQPPPVSQHLIKTTNYRKTETTEGGKPSDHAPLPFGNTISSESHSNWDQDEGNVKKHFESNRTYTRTESSNVVPLDSGAGFHQNHSSYSSSAAPFSNGQTGNRQITSSYNSGSAPWTTTSKQNWQTNQSTGGGFGNQNVGSSNAHWTRNDNRNTAYSGSAYPGSEQRQGQGTNNAANSHRITTGSGPGNFRSASALQNPIGDNNYSSSSLPRHYRNTKSVTPGRQTSATPVNYDGPRMYYQKNPRTARELSPQATVQHLQYNSPLAMYSPHAASEQYKMHTGQDLIIDGDYPSNNRPAYLDSATRRAVAEEDQGRHYRSPTPQQSGSFKRISYAVGTPVN